MTAAAYVVCPSCRDLYLRDEPWKRVCLSCYIKQKNRAPRPAPPSAPIPLDMLRRLIQLCHPDKHGGSEVANEVTRWLLTLRRPAP